jgi:hypothetical protein
MLVIKMGKFLKATFLFGVVAIILSGCTSRKGDYMQVLYEAKEFEKSLKDMRPLPDRQFLQGLIAKVETDGKSRWRVSTNPNHLLETTRAYTNYQKRSSKQKCFYVIDLKGMIVLIDK